MREHAKDPLLINPFYFKNKVQTNGEWDLKNTEEYNSSKYINGFVFYGEKIRYDAPGNIHYGYVGSSTYYGSDFILYYFAGKHQKDQNTSKKEWEDTSRGDDPYDQEMIKYGIQLQTGIGSAKRN